MRSMVGKELSSRGVLTKKVRIRTAREKVMLVARSMSRKKAGMGTIIAVSMMPKAKIIQVSLCFIHTL